MSNLTFHRNKQSGMSIVGSGKITMDCREMVQLILDYIDYEKEQEAKGVPELMQDSLVEHVFNDFLKRHDEKLPEDIGQGGLLAYECDVLIPERTVFERFKKCMKQKTSFHADYVAKRAGKGDWFTYISLVIR